MEQLRGDDTLPPFLGCGGCGQRRDSDNCLQSQTQCGHDGGRVEICGAWLLYYLQPSFLCSDVKEPVYVYVCVCVCVCGFIVSLLGMSIFPVLKTCTYSQPT